MPDKFNMQSPPFDRLTNEQQRQLKASLDVAYFRANSALLNIGQPVQHLHVFIKVTV